MSIPIIVASQAGIAAGIAARNARRYEEEREVHRFRVTGEGRFGIDWGVPKSRLPKKMTVEVKGYYPDYTDAIHRKLREYALATDPSQISEAGPFGFCFEEV